MDIVKIKLNESEIEIPKSDLDWFVKEKGAKLIGAEKKEKTNKETQNTKTDE